MVLNTTRKHLLLTQKIPVHLGEGNEFGKIMEAASISSDPHFKKISTSRNVVIKVVDNGLHKKFKFLVIFSKYIKIPQNKVPKTIENGVKGTIKLVRRMIDG